MIKELVLASASPARLQTLQRAGVAVSVQVSGVDEDAVAADSVTELVARLAELKAEAVFVQQRGDVAVLGCDSLLELDGCAYGKPGTPSAAVATWRRIRGRPGQLLTGHHLIVRTGEAITRLTKTAVTHVEFADLADAEIDAYVATGEPAQVAGAFTIDGRGGAFVTRIDGDHHNVVGLSLPLLRTMLADAGVPWTDVWPAGSADRTA